MLPRLALPPPLILLAITVCSCNSDEAAAGGGASGGGGGAAGSASGGATSAGGASPGTAGSSGDEGGTPNAGASGTAAAADGGTSAGGGGAGPSAGGGAAAGSGAATGAGGSGGGYAGSAGAASCVARAQAPLANVTVCPPAASGTEPEPAAALSAVNELRAHMGLGCTVIANAISDAAERHCLYYQQNKNQSACIANPHQEVEGCAGFVAVNFYDRMTKAGYTGSARAEVMAFSGNAVSAVEQWVNTVYHRTPLLSPWIRELGYGKTSGCDTIDMGQGPKTADDVTAVYPYPGQVGVPREFNGQYEGPTPPAPPTGWPSASPIHVYAQNYVVTRHVVHDQACEELEHTWIAEKTDYIFYPHVPFASKNTYHVRVEGSRNGIPLDFDWTFTTE